MALKEALGWKEQGNLQTIFLMHMGSVALSKAFMPQSVTLVSVTERGASTINNEVAWEHLATLYQALTISQCLRALKFKQLSLEADKMRTGYFRAPGCVAYLLNQNLPFCSSMSIMAVWHKDMVKTERHAQFFKVC